VGVREQLTDSIVFCVQNLKSQDYENMILPIVRTACEIGSVRILHAAVERGADLNFQEGLPLYSSVYNGNYEIVQYLLKDSNNDTTTTTTTTTTNTPENGPAHLNQQTRGRRVDTTLFGWRQKMFCAGLILIEGFALIMFSLLVLIWILGIVKYYQPNNNNNNSNNNNDSNSPELNFSNTTTTSSNTTTTTTTTTSTTGATGIWYDPTDSIYSLASGVSVAEMSGMAVPSGIALVVMYRLVPFHRMVLGLLAVCVEDKKRRKLDDALRRTERQVEEV
jgi:hypothetical protein